MVFATNPSKSPVIVVTDSGLGGISILAELAAGISSGPRPARISLVYFNAWPEQDRGYNRLADDRERIRVFHRALDAMMGFAPDRILIACNTLSVLYDKTPFARAAPVPVTDIVHSGVSMIFDKLASMKEARVVILGTLTTIASNAHATLLAQQGVPPDRIVGQSCDQLATAIERTGPDSDDTRRLIAAYADEAKEKIGTVRGEILIALCCTHYAFSRHLIADRFSQGFGKPVEIVDPNRSMVANLPEQLFSGGQSPGGAGSTVPEIRVVSRIRLDEKRRSNVAELVRHRSEAVADALENYDYDPDLFTF